MNSLCLEPEFAEVVPGLTVGPAPAPARPGGVAVVRSIRPQAGLLACIESIARDRKLPASQYALLQRFPRRCRRFQPDEGRIDYRDALELMAELGLTDSFETVREVAGIAGLGGRIDRGVILCVPRSGGAELRWWRLAAVGGPGISAMQPEAEDPAQLAEVTWTELEETGAWALALD